MDKLGVKLVVSGENAILSSTSLVLAVKTVDGTNFPTTAVNIFNPNNVQVSQCKQLSEQKKISHVILCKCPCHIHIIYWTERNDLKKWQLSISSSNLSFLSPAQFYKKDQVTQCSSGLCFSSLVSDWRPESEWAAPGQQSPVHLLHQKHTLPGS